AYQLGWFPDYSDADNYLTPFFLSATSFLHNHYANPQVDSLIQQEATTTDPTARAKVIGQAQDAVAKDLSTIPYLQGSQVAVVAQGVQGTKDTLDASFKFRYGALSKQG
ncbi:MAG TPA: peptide ABC transporter substrate-binding protein, partial [Actinotalea sp.]